MRDDLGGHDAAETAAGSKVAAMGVGVEEAGGVGVAGAGGVDDGDPLFGVDDVHFVAADDDGALLAAREAGDLGMAADVLQGFVEVGDLVEGEDLSLVGEEDVDVVVDQLDELVAEAVDAEGVGGGEGDFDAGCWALMAALRMASLARGWSQR